MPKTIVFQSDFTYKEGAVAAMYGVVKQVDPDLEIIDLTHEIPKFDIWSASFRLHQVVPFWPKGTVFVSVVDPGVGTARKACVAKTKSGHVIVTPDNKTLTHIAKFIGLEEVREIPTQLRFASPYKTAVFHGRDVFGYVGALLASGQIEFEELGVPYQDYQANVLEEPRIEVDKLVGIVEILDPNFGNAWTNIPITWTKQVGIEFNDLVEIDIYEKERLALQLIVPYKATFGGVHVNEAVMYANELECLALAINQNSFINTYHIHQGPDWCICIKKASYV